jgi:hypothetical protein
MPRSQFAVRRRRERLNPLALQVKAVFDQRAADVLYPLNLALALCERGVIGARDVNAVAPGVFGGTTGEVRGAQQVGQAAARGSNRCEPDAGRNVEALVLPDEAELVDRRCSPATTCSALSRGQLANKTPISSPPRRASTSDLRRRARSARPSWRNSSSPAMCPQVSLITLKRSRSM